MSGNLNKPARHLYRYEDILRAVGQFIDDEGIQDVIVMQKNDELHVHGYRNVSPSGGLNPVLVERRFSAEEIQQIDEESRRRRGTRSRLFG
jgi:hypothetical protein